MARRVYVGQLPGGPGILNPSVPFRFHIEPHAPGRLHAEREKLLHMVCLKAWGKLGDNPTLGYSGAVHQDFKGTQRYPRCDRSLFEPIVNGSPIPDFPGFVSQSGLRMLLLTPLAVTDPVPPQGNYGDRLLEIAAAKPIVDLMRSAVLRQPANRPLEINMLQDVLAGELPTLLQKGYDDAVYKGENILKERGWINVPINTKPPIIAEAARIWATTPRGRTDSRAAKAIEDLMQGLRSTEPQS